MEKEIKELEKVKEENEIKEEEIKSIEDSEKIYGFLGGDEDDTEPEVD